MQPLVGNAQRIATPHDQPLGQSWQRRTNTSIRTNTSPTTARRNVSSGSATARLLGLQVWIPPGAWMSVMSVAQRSSADCSVSFCGIQKPQEWGSSGPREVGQCSKEHVNRPISCSEEAKLCRPLRKHYLMKMCRGEWRYNFRYSQHRH
jgi:hypothetical protein